jgi:hypothetical protein
MKAINGNSLYYRLMCIFLYKRIIKSYSRTAIYYDKENMNVNKLQKNLILCNHDLWPIDILLVPFFLHEILNIPVSIVTSRNYMDYYINKELFADYNLIPVGNSVEKIISEINSGRTVVLFLNWVNKSSIYNNSSIKRIIELTGCSPILLTLDLSDCITEKYKRHPFIYSCVKTRYVKTIKEKKLKYTKEAENHIQNITGSRLRILQFLLGGKINIVLTSSDPFESYEETCNNIGYLENLKLKGRKKIRYETYTKLIVPKSLVAKYLKCVKYK